MAEGVPGIVSCVSGVDDLVVDGVSGFVFEPGDEEDYVRALKRGAPWRTRAMTIMRETCGIDRIVILHAAVYRKLLPGGVETSTGDLPLPCAQAPIAGAK